MGAGQAYKDVEIWLGLEQQTERKHSVGNREDGQQAEEGGQWSWEVELENQKQCLGSPACSSSVCLEPGM